MELKNRLKRLIKKLEDIKNNSNICGDALCGTCGGVAGAIRESMDKQLNNEILEVLALVDQMDTNDILLLGEWSFALDFLYYGNDNIKTLISRHSQYRRDRELHLATRRAKNIILDTDLYGQNIRAIDYFLFNNWYLRVAEESKEFRELYETILQTGIALAIKTHDYSLIESILAILRNGARNYPDFFNLALDTLPEKVLERSLGSDWKRK